MKRLVDGDYVLATKYNDGDPMDHFCVGFFRGMLGDRFLVEDNNGQLFRASGFRRCEKISQHVGNALVAAMTLIGDVPGASLWYWRYHPCALDELRTANKNLSIVVELAGKRGGRDRK